jgi:DNA-binding NarL/FixJ family response regulator
MLGLGMNNITVLIADQNAAFGAAASRFIASLPGFSVISHTLVGDDVLAEYVLHRPDVVLLNFAYASDLAGLDMLRRLKHRQSAPRVILVVPLADPAYDEHGRQAGADGCIACDQLEVSLPPLMDRLFPSVGRA